MYVSLQSYNYPDRFIRHSYFLGELTPIQTRLDQYDATFDWTGIWQFGARGKLRSINYPDRVLRHQYFRIKLDPLGQFGGSPPNDPLLNDDSEFYMVRGLADPSNDRLVSFRSKNYPTRYIRHRGFHLFLEPADSDLAKQDATFKLREGGPFISESPHRRSQWMRCSMEQYCPYIHGCPYI